MASPSSVPAAAAAKVSSSVSVALAPRGRRAGVSFPLPARSPRPLLLLPSKGSRSCLNGRLVARAQLNEVAGGSSNHAASVDSKLETPASKEKDSESEKQQSPSAPLSEEAVSEFMNQVASLVKLVDSKDIVELQLKQLDCEIVIRKKAALPQPPTPAPVVMMHQSPTPMPMTPQYPSAPPAAALPSAAAAAPSSPSAPKQAKSSHPPLKSPMAGTFYRSPGPGLAPFVKVGDKVKKGQVLCIIEAMKLMNEIEADHAGTLVEILVDDGKSVGVEQPLFVIEP